MDKDYFIAVFFALLISILLFYLPNISTLQAYKYALGLVFIAAIGLVFDFKKLLVVFFVMFAFAYLNGTLPYVIVFEVHLALFFLGLFFSGEREMDETLGEKANNWKAIATSFGWAIVLLIAIVALLLAFSFAMAALHLKPDSFKVYEKVKLFPFHIILFAIVFAPISEEVFFRAFLTERFGILISAAAFGFSHFIYGSLYEIVGAFFIGLVLAYFYVKKRNLAACMIAHGLFNLLSLALMFNLSKQVGI